MCSCLLDTWCAQGISNCAHEATYPEPWSLAQIQDHTLVTVTNQELESRLHLLLSHIPIQLLSSLSKYLLNTMCQALDFYRGHSKEPETTALAPRELTF